MEIGPDHDSPFLITRYRIVSDGVCGALYIHSYLVLYGGVVVADPDLVTPNDIPRRDRIGRKSAVDRNAFISITRDHVVVDFVVVAPDCHAVEIWERCQSGSVGAYEIALNVIIRALVRNGHAADSIPTDEVQKLSFITTYKVLFALMDHHANTVSIVENRVIVLPDADQISHHSITSSLYRYVQFRFA